MLWIKGLIKTTIAFILTGFFVIFLQNCRSGNQKSGDLPICNPKLKARIPMALGESKVLLSEQTLQALQDGSAEVHLGLIVRTRCILELENPLYVLGQEVKISEDLQSLDKVALDLTVTGPFGEEEIKREIDQSPCLLNLTDNNVLELDNGADVVQGGAVLAQKSNDPDSNEQAHLNFLNYSKSFEVQDHITEEVLVAVLSTGINSNHPDLRRRMYDSIIGGGHGRNFTVKPGDNRTSDHHGEGPISREL